jgi:prevent-host-death family protein
MSTVVNIHEAKTHLSRLLEQVMQGEEVVIAKSGKPVARLVALGGSAKRREPGSARGQIKMAEDFDDPLPEDIQRFFE